MKINILSIKMKNLVVNLTIVFMLIAISSLMFFGIKTTPVATKINGVYTSGSQNLNKISLMINVYWGTEYLDDMLDILDKYDAKVTFFVGGTWAGKENDMLKKMIQKNHEIANHAYSHKDLDKVPKEMIENEIMTTHNIVKNTTGVSMNLFAPPSGAYSKTTVEVANELGYNVIMWTRDTIDWRDRNSDVIYERAVRNAKGGDFVLMHPTKATLDALEKIITTLQTQGFILTTVGDNLS